MSKILPRAYYVSMQNLILVIVRTKFDAQILTITNQVNYHFIFRDISVNYLKLLFILINMFLELGYFPTHITPRKFYFLLNYIYLKEEIISPYKSYIENMNYLHIQQKIYLLQRKVI